MVKGVKKTGIRFFWLPKHANYFKTVLRESHHPGKRKQAGDAPKKRGGRRRKLIPTVLTKNGRCIRSSLSSKLKQRLWVGQNGV